mmetsp:Transcript_102604/g.125435  ORF Transcript_102604/g.125435 Transcript_102604/m.125435 type:complete len:260 (-) Transcript_102604:16-795(-)
MAKIRRKKRHRNKMKILFNMENMKDITYHHICVLSLWQSKLIDENQQTMLTIDIKKIIIHYCEFSYYWYIPDNTENISFSDVKSNDLWITFEQASTMKMIRLKESLPLTECQIHIKIECSTDRIGSLLFMGLCGDLYTEYDKYVVFSNKVGITGVGNDMNRDDLCWKYRGNGLDPKPWYGCSHGIIPNDNIILKVSKYGKHIERTFNVFKLQNNNYIRMTNAKDKNDFIIYGKNVYFCVGVMTDWMDKHTNVTLRVSIK